MEQDLVEKAKKLGDQEVKTRLQNMKWALEFMNKYEEKQEKLKLLRNRDFERIIIG